MRKIIDKHGVVAFLFISLVAFLSLYKSLFFYFGGDDFSMFYYAKNSICPVTWPFTSYCPIFQRLYFLFGYKPMPYYLLGLVTRIFLGTTFYFLVKKLFDKGKLALLVSLILVSVAGEDVLIIFYSIWENIGLGLLALSSYFLLDADKNNKSGLLLAICLFAISLLFFPIYSTAHFLIVLFILLSFVRNKLHFKWVLISFLIFTLLTLKTYVYEPFKYSGNAGEFIERAFAKNEINKFYLAGKIKNYFSTTGAFFLTDYLESSQPLKFIIKYFGEARFYIGIIFNLSILLLLFLNRKDRVYFNKGLFALFWLVSQYLPRGLVTSFGLSSTDRHIFYPYTGFVLILAAFFFRKAKYLVPISLLLIILNIFQSNVFLSKHLISSRQRESFYNDFRKYLSKKDIQKQTVFYIDSPLGEIHKRVGDFVRAGIPSEGSIATELNIKYEDITLITESTDLPRHISDKTLSPGKFFSFYYDGNKLLDTTAQAINFITANQTFSKPEISGSGLTKFVHNQNSQNWTGANDTLLFQFKNLSPIIPSELSINLKASVSQIPLPYTQKCQSCEYRSDLLYYYLNYLSLSKNHKKNLRVAVSSVSDNKEPQNLVDNSLDTFWVPLRQEWFQGIKPTITILLDGNKKIDGLIIFSGSKNNFPLTFELKADGRQIAFDDIERYGERIKIVTKSLEAKEIELKILNTTGDRPSIDEIDIIPAGFFEADLILADYYRSSPAGFLKTDQDRNALYNYLRSGADACMEWENKFYGKGKIPFILLADGKVHNYKISLPSMGLEIPTLRIGCIDYPVNLKLFSAELRFLGDN